ncbi:MAG TPA: class I SAM-dependent methyltransferase [Micromonosporaceae bacterium]
MYEATAEFYDLLQGPAYLERATKLIETRAGQPQLGILDVGAGTGLATAEFARRFRIDVHAVEPAVSMRSIMLSRLAGHADLLSHVRVHELPVQHLGLTGAVDLAWCMNMVGGLDRPERQAALAAIREALVPGGILLVQRPPSEPGERADLGSWDLGGDRYAGEMTCRRTGDARLEWRFTYRVTRGDTCIREVSEVFPGFLVTEAQFVRELEQAGLTPTEIDQDDVITATATRPRQTV